MALYQGTHRINSTRLPGWDYASAGYYYVTICTRKKIPYFGEVAGEDIHLTAIGEYAYHSWAEIPAHFSHVSLDEYIIMPNHLHGIIIINDVETQHAASLQKNKIPSPSPGSLSAIIRAYKSAVTRWAHLKSHPTFAWQPRFYDHIIRDQASLDRIRAYILDNPHKWDEDEENPKNITHS